MTIDSYYVSLGKSPDSIEELCNPNTIKTETITYFLEPEGGETFPDLISRAGGLLARLKGEHTADEKVLLVGHGDFGKMVKNIWHR